MKLIFEVVAGKEEAARRTAQILGFAPIAILSNHIRDVCGTSYDLVIMELSVSDVVPDVPEIF